jgi:hypothetical protein
LESVPYFATVALIALILWWSARHRDEPPDGRTRGILAMREPEAPQQQPNRRARRARRKSLRP